MFNFLRSWLSGKAQGGKLREQARPGVQLLAAMLVCFPEIETVSYDPRRGLLTMNFIVRTEVAAETMETFSVLLMESIETFHAIEDGFASVMDFSYEWHDTLTIIHFARRMDELSERELSLIIQLMRQQFGAYLLVDAHGVDVLDAEFSFLQRETLERMLSAVREIPLRDRLVGIRERDQVVVYNR